MRMLNERSRLPVTFKFFDAGTRPSVPSTVHYRIDCLTSGAVLVDWTALETAAVVTIVIPATVNAILNRSNNFEIKEMTVEANQGTVDAYTETYPWKVRNIEGVA